MSMMRKWAFSVVAQLNRTGFKTQLWYSYLFLKICFISVWKAKLQGEGGAEKEILHLQVHFLNGSNRQNWTHLKPGARNLLWVSYVGTGTQELEPSATAFSGHKQGTWLEVKQRGLEPLAIWDACAKGGSLTSCTMALALGYLFIMANSVL